MWPELTDRALSLGDETVTFADLWLLGSATGLLEDAMSTTRRGMWALQEGGADPPREQVLQTAVAFRRTRKLESGQDLRAWLEARELTMDDWEAHLRRSLAGRELDTSPEEPSPWLDVDLDGHAFSVDLACSGSWKLVADLAARLWAAARLVEDQSSPAESDFRVEASRIMSAHDELASFGEPWCIEGLRSLRTRERALEEVTRRCSTTEAVEARLVEHSTDWTTFRFDELDLSSPEAAKEALLCAREDGLSAADLAIRTGLQAIESFSRRDSLPVAIATLLDGAVPDQPFGPVALDGRWAVVWLRERCRPSMADESTRAAAAAELLNEALEKARVGLIREAAVL